jgi:hypothetical protein
MNEKASYSEMLSNAVFAEMCSGDTKSMYDNEEETGWTNEEVEEFLKSEGRTIEKLAEQALENIDCIVAEELERRSCRGE